MEDEVRMRRSGKPWSTPAATVTLALAGACWVVTLRQMAGIDMGAATDVGSLASFVAVWVPMTAAMMLPSAVPAVSSFAGRHRRGLAAPAFAGSYLLVWTLAGLVVYVLYRPHGSAVAGALTVAAGLYELAPWKRACRRRCREAVRSGFHFGWYCVGSSAGLMAVLVSLGIMSVTWMVVVGVLVGIQKLLPPTALLDLPVAAALVGLGVLVMVAPSSVPTLVA